MNKDGLMGDLKLTPSLQSGHEMAAKIEAVNALPNPLAADLAKVASGLPHCRAVA